MDNGFGTLPQHVAIIMDGNGRWAKSRGLPRVHGHARGAQSVRETVETAARVGVEYLTLYAFSVANWSRPTPEVEALMNLLCDFAKGECELLQKNGISVNVAGHLDELPERSRKAVDALMRATADGHRMTLTLALSYGGRQDILAGARALVMRAQAGLLGPEDVTEELLRQGMSTSALPDVDLLIRTGGEARLSDFLLFESAYAELVFLPIMWPEFRSQHLLDALEGFTQKERRFGKTSEQLQRVAPSNRIPLGVARG